MNKTRIMALVLLIVGLLIKFTVDNDATDFVSGLLIGIGLGLLLTGRIGKPSNS